MTDVDSPGRPYEQGSHRRFDSEIYKLTPDEKKLVRWWGPHFCEHQGAASRARSVNNSQNNAALQTASKAGEVTLVRILGLPIWHLKWLATTGSDDGWDIKFDRDTLDAKTSWASSAQFLWASRAHVENGVLPPHAVVADKLVLCQAGKTGEWGLVRGWMLRDRFYKLHRVAGKGHLLDPGTAYVEVWMLYDIRELVEAYKERHFEPDLQHEAKRKREFAEGARMAGLSEEAIAKFLEEA